MDTGHYNCRDYHISPHWSASTIVSERPPYPNPNPILYRHESFDELEQRSRSPASQRPKFPLLRLPLELRQQIVSYLLPHTQKYRDSGLLGDHVRNFSAVQKRGERGMVIPSSNNSSVAGISNVVWQRGNTSLLSVCKQLHDECSKLIYGTNTFLLFITYAHITFRFRWLLPSGLAPSKSLPILELMPARYLRLVKRVVVHVDHVDSYTGMIKFNVGGKGLTHGMRRQIQKLVNALREGDEDGDGEKRLSKVSIRVSNSNSTIESLKSEYVRQREGGVKVAEDLEIMLEPFGDLRGVREVTVSGAVTDRYARSLEATMMGLDDRPEMKPIKILDEDMASMCAAGVQLCVYGNDMT